MAHLGFNPSAVEPSIPTGLLPKGRYIVICDKSEVKPTKKGTGHILALQFIVQEGEYKKRKIFDNINIQNENHIAQRIGQQHLAAFCHAIGITHLDNSYQLHGIPVEIEIGIQEAKNGWEARNVIKGFVKKAEVNEANRIDLSTPPPVQVPSPLPAMGFANTIPKPATVSIADIDDDIPF